MRVIVCGSRDGIDGRLVRSELARMHSIRPITCIVHGCARGVDSDAGEWARQMKIGEEPHPADWKGHGKAAGAMRNRVMADLGADACLAIHSGTPGTRDMMRRARSRGIPVFEVVVIDSRVSAAWGDNELRPK